MFPFWKQSLFKRWAQLKKQSVSLRRAIEAFLDSKNKDQITTVNYRRTLETELVKPMKVKARNGKITLKLNGEVNYVVVK